MKVSVKHSHVYFNLCILVNGLQMYKIERSEQHTLNSSVKTNDPSIHVLCNTTLTKCTIPQYTMNMMNRLNPVPVNHD